MKLNSKELSAADSFIEYLCQQVEATAGTDLRDRYIGFCVTTISTHAETFLKTNILEFCKTQNRYLFSVIENDLKKLNGKISYDDLKKQLSRFDKGFEQRFIKILNRLNTKSMLQNGQTNIFESYKSLLSTRHSFVHNLNEQFPQIAPNDLKNYALSAKKISSAFARSLTSKNLKKSLKPNNGPRKTLKAEPTPSNQDEIALSILNFLAFIPKSHTTHEAIEKLYPFLRSQKILQAHKISSTLARAHLTEAAKCHIKYIIEIIAQN